MHLLQSLPVPTLLLGLAARAAADAVSATPHDSYSSSVGVLGCKINTDRVAYWPGSVDCNNICVKLTYEGRSVNLLRIDQSGGAHDISYDAWVYLQSGKTAASNPLTGGGVDMEYEEVDASECADLILTDDSKLPLSASNSMNFVTSCLAQPDSWVAQNHVLYNICDAICSLGYDEQCSLDLGVSTQPSCPHTLGLTSKLTSAPVYNVEYQSGTKVNAATGDVVSADTAPADDSDSASKSTEASATTAAPAAVAKPATTTTSEAVPVVQSTVAPVVAPAETSLAASSPTTLTTVRSPVASTSSPTTTSTTSQEPSLSPGIFVATSETVVSQATASPSGASQTTGTSSTKVVPTTFAVGTISATGYTSTSSPNPSGSATVAVNRGSANAAVSKVAALAVAAMCCVLLV